MAKVLVALYLVLVPGLLAGAAAIWRLRCESFGCMGLGVAWFAWAVAFFVVLGLGALTRLRAVPPRLARARAAVAAVQLAAGLAALAVWAVKSL